MSIPLFHSKFSCTKLQVIRLGTNNKHDPALMQQVGDGLLFPSGSRTLLLAGYG